MNYEIDKDKFKERIQLLIGEEKPYPWADRIGLTPGVFNRMWKEGTVPKADSLVLISNATGVSIDWLITGEGLKKKGQLSDGSSVIYDNCGKSNVDAVSEEPMEYGTTECYSCKAKAPVGDTVLVSRYNVQPSAGHGSTFENEQVVCHMPFSRKWLKNMGLQSDKLAIVSAMGDSMHPTIKDGSLLMIDTSKVEATDGIFVLKMAGELMVKRLQRSPLDQSVTIKSDNDSYVPIIAKEDQLNLLDIVGKVVWIGSKA